MKLPNKKSKLQHVIETVEDSLDGANSIGRGLARMSSKKQLKAAVPESARTAGLIAVAAAGLTAGSAGISSYRRRHREEADNDS